MLQLVGPSYAAKPHLFRRSGIWWCAMKGGGPMAANPKAATAYAHWRTTMRNEHGLRFAHDPGHAMYFPGDPEWRWEGKP